MDKPPVTRVTEDNYRQELDTAKLVVILFHMGDQPRSRAMMDLMRDIAAARREELKVLFLDVLEQPSTVEDLMGIPVLLSIKDGRAISRVSGLASWREVEGFIDDSLREALQGDPRVNTWTKPGGMTPRV